MNSKKRANIIVSLNEMRIRLVYFYKKNGLMKTIIRIPRVLQRRLIHHKYVIFCVDLYTLNCDNASTPEWFEIECKQTRADLKENEIKELYSAHDARIVERQLNERFSEGAWLWMVKFNQLPAGFVWTMKAQTIKQYFIPLGDGDISLVDNVIFAHCRSRGINPVLIDNVLFNLKKKGFARAYIETHWSNTAEIRSLEKTNFKRIAIARIYQILGKTAVLWYRHK